MRCSCCDRVLNDYESTRKNRATGEYLDMCNKCSSFVEDSIETIDRSDLSEGDIPDEETFFGDDSATYGELYDDDE